MFESYLIDDRGYFIEPIFIEGNQILLTEVEEEAPEVIGQDKEGNDILENRIVKKLVPRMDIVYPVYIGNEEIYVAELPDGLFNPQFDFELREWKNGLTPEDIEEIKNRPVKPNEIEKLKQENILLKAQNQALADRTDFHEDLIAEMAMIVYP